MNSNPSLTTLSPLHLPRRRALQVSCAAWGGGTRKRLARGRRSYKAGGIGAELVVALWPLTLAGARLAPTWETWWPQQKAFPPPFLFYIVIMFVIIPTEYLQSDRPLETSFFMDILMEQNTNKTDYFCLYTVTAYMKSYTLYCIYAILAPAQPWRDCVADGGPWWWERVVGGGGRGHLQLATAPSILQGVLLQSYQPRSVSRRGIWW